ncbi:lipoprotein [Leptospira sp. 2 VSF19]|uniref:Lipoprotein n=1 Tax=Leptospira soteropolitanensis TaxID=2950025 RepID=A0AAW5VEW6_9LEPT|nr:lipoprotein [Leptospira soteropolitanensis]MCW7492912.1 lipoprotein [Leptospira soteropolitanensis]MCW7500147.1 lipoprotein [Leptospira soteropolitanensis]MCW7522398.1 lipoprotein [Leptospira soteropolitanensis]MCW7526254.1 lipoprotein [Leptospira soteropolitanensis]MCW7529634.1 lipoprotein [Leptospira soteropolitanensis]
MNKTLTKIILSIAFAILVWSCKSKETKEVVPPTKDIENEAVLEFTKAKEGFISETLFQVAVSSVLETEAARVEEAKTIAEQKSLNLLKTYTIPNLSDKGRKELREISKEGKIVDKNVSIGGRYFFLYQIQKSNLKRLVTKDLE